MSYASSKGYSGEIEFADICNEAIGSKYRAERIGNAESGKQWLFGDVAIVNDKNGTCVLSDYFLEAKKHSAPSMWKIMIEAEQNAQQYGKSGAIAYIIRQKKGEHTGMVNNDKYIVMTPKTFIRIIHELQGYRT